MTIQRPPGADGPLPVLVSGERGQARGGVLGPAGVLRFAPIRTRELAFRFSPPQTPLQISGVTIPGVPALQTPSGPFRLPCGLGPVVELDGRVLPTQVTGTFAELLAGQPMPFTACPAARIAAGANRVAEPPTDPFDVQDVVLEVHQAGAPPASAAQGSGTPGGAALGPAPGPATAAVIRSWTPARRVLAVAAPARSYLVVNENFNRGWQARLDGRPLPAIRLDGWKQAWLLPAGSAGTVTLTYLPDALYRDALGGGLGGLALVVLVALWPGTPAWRPRWLRLPRAWRRAKAPKDTARAAGPDGGVSEAGPEHAGAGGSSQRRWRPRSGLTTTLATAGVARLPAAGRAVAGRLPRRGHPHRRDGAVRGRGQLPAGPLGVVPALPPVGGGRPASGRGGLRCGRRAVAARRGHRPADDGAGQHRPAGHLPGRGGQAGGRPGRRRPVGHALAHRGLPAQAGRSAGGSHAVGSQPPATFLPSNPVARKNPSAGPGRAAGTGTLAVAMEVARER